MPPIKTRDLQQKRLSLLRELIVKRSLEPNTDRVIRRRALQISPLSFAQQRLWLLSQLIPDSPIYNVPVVLRFSGSLEIAVLKRGLNEVVRRHEIRALLFPDRRVILFR